MDYNSEMILITVCYEYKIILVFILCLVRRWMELEGWMKNERLSIHLGLLFCILPNWKDEGRIDGAFKDGL